MIILSSCKTQLTVYFITRTSESYIFIDADSMKTSAGAVVAVFLLLQLTIHCGATSQSLCQGDTCHVSPDNFWKLQDIVRSNRFIVLNGEKFGIHDRIGFIVIENVSNLTISGGGSGSLIQCSPQSAFGLHLKNTTNFTLTGINITHCGPVTGPDHPSVLRKHLSNTYPNY